MGKITKAVGWTAGVGGAAVTLGLQVPPDQAASNAALWVEAFTGRMPNWPHQVDWWLTAISVAVALTPAVIWLWPRRRTPPLSPLAYRAKMWGQLRKERPDLPIFRDWKFIPFVEVAELAAGYGIPLPRYGRAQNNAYHLEGELRQWAVRGHLKVEGRLNRGPLRDNDPLVEIPKEHFANYGFNHGVLGYDVPNEAAQTGGISTMLRAPNGIPDVTYYDIYVSEAEARQVLQDFARSDKNERPE